MCSILKVCSGLFILAVFLLVGCTQVQPTPEPTATPTPEPTATPVPSTFLKTLEKVPAEFLDDGVWFGHPARALEIAGLEPVRDWEAYESMPKEERDAYNMSKRGIGWPTASSYAYQTDKSIWPETFDRGMDLTFYMGIWGRGRDGFPFDDPAYIEGEFDEEALKSELIELGYEEREAHGFQYFLLRESGSDILKAPPPVNHFYFNQIYVGDGRLVSTGVSESMEAVLGTLAGEVTSVAEDKTLAALAASLGDPLGAAILPRELVLDYSRLATRERPEEWGQLHIWDYVAMGFRKDSEEEKWHRFSLLYSHPEAAEADAQELVRRMETYKTRLSDEVLDERGWKGVPTVMEPLGYCESFTASHTSGEGYSVLTVECTFSDIRWATKWLDHLLITERLAFLTP